MSDRVYDAEDKLDAFCKAIDKLVEVFRSEVKKKAGGHVKSLIIEYKYKSEHLAAKFEGSVTTCTDAAYTCQEARKGSRMHALHSGIEEPPTVVTIQAPANSHHDNNYTSSMQGGTQGATESITLPVSKAHKARRMLVEDDEDISYQQEVARKKASAAAEAARLAVLEAQKAPDFGFHYSIDAEKREFGAALELLALPTHDDLCLDDGECRCWSRSVIWSRTNSTGDANLQKIRLGAGVNLLLC
jgi:hypothetical protein